MFPYITPSYFYEEMDTFDLNKAISCMDPKAYLECFPEARMEKNRAKLLEFWEELPPLFVCSSETGAGKEEILDYIGRLLDEMRESAG